MSIVKMDMSEYEALKKVESLLEESLINERILKQELIDAQEEKIAAYKENAKTVTIVEAIEETEHLKVLRPASDIWRWLGDLIDRRKRGELSLNFPVCGADGVYRDELDMVARAFFDTHTTTSYKEKTIVRKGLDEVIVEIKDEVKSEMSAATKEKLARGEKFENKYDELLKESTADAKVIKLLRKENEELDGMYHKLLKSHEEVNDLLEKYTVILAKIEKEIQAKGFLRSTKAFNTIKKLIVWEE